MATHEIEMLKASLEMLKRERNEIVERQKQIGTTTVTYLKMATHEVEMLKASLEMLERERNEIVERQKQIGNSLLIDFPNFIQSSLEVQTELRKKIDILQYNRARETEVFVNLLNSLKEEQENAIKDKEIIKELRSELFEAKQKILMLETEREMLRLRTNIQTSRESVQSLRERDNPRSLLRSTDIRSTPRPNSEQMVRKVKSVSTMHPSGRKRENIINDNRTKMSTGTNVTEMKETITYSRRTSINGVPTNINPMEMEDDEDDVFNNQFLTDMKAGRRRRLLELACRNSLVPHHLKSSYPAEIQVFSPTHFKEDDLKYGGVELDDNLCKLLPSEKPRQKKDFGYKKPSYPQQERGSTLLAEKWNLPLCDHKDSFSKKKHHPQSN